MSDEEAVLSHPEMVLLLKQMAANGTHEYSVHWHTVEKVSKFGVRPEEAALFAVVSRKGWEHGLSVNRSLWQFGQYLGEEDFRKVSTAFKLGLESTIEELRKMLDAGMGVEELSEFSHWYDDGSWSCGRLDVDDILSLWRQKVPGTYYGGVAKHMDWTEVPSVRRIIEMKVEGVPADAANVMLQSGLTPRQVIDCFLGGIPVEYAVELAHVG